MIKTVSIITTLSVVTFGVSTGKEKEVAAPIVVDVTVKDEAGEPMPGVEIGGYCIGIGGSEPAFLKTDEKGEVTFRGNTWLRFGVSSQPDGYYRSGVQVPGNKGEDPNPPPVRRTAELVLREIKNPVELFVKRLEIVPPAIGKKFGYDLSEGDFTPPYGDGNQADLLITAELLRDDGARDFDIQMNVAFSNPDDGIIALTQVAQSKYKAPFYDAPDEGYVGKWVYSRSARPGKPEKTNSVPNRCFVLRLRTRRDYKGNVISANYAKIYGDFPTFVYYYNPRTNDRNLEFNPARNLAKGETITKP